MSKFEVQSSKFERGTGARTRIAATYCLMSALVFCTAIAQQRDTNKPPAAAVTTAEISGVVQSPDGQPIKRAVVTLSGDVPAPRSVVSDDGGAFTFPALPTGSFTVTARKAAHLAAPYGTTRPGRTGTPITLAAGQRTTIKLTMFRGAAISGMLRDSAGLPVPGVDVRLIDARTLSSLDTAPVELIPTDDRGIFRIYNILPGEYIVVALPSTGGGEIGAPSAMDLDAKLAALTARERGLSPATSVTSTAVPASRPIGFAPIFYPGTPHHGDAVRVRVAAGEERTGIDFELKPVPVSAIDATVSGVPDLAAVEVTLIPTGPRFATIFSSSNLAGRPIDAQGQLRYSNLPPGRYRLVARARHGNSPSPAPAVDNGVAQVAGGGRGGGTPTPRSSAAATGDYLFGYADIDLRGDDVAGISLPLQAGAVMSGKIIVNELSAGTKPIDLPRARLYVSPEGGAWSVGTSSPSGGSISLGPGFISQAISTIHQDGTFEIRGIGPGRFTVGLTLPSEAKGWTLRSVMAANRDLLDDPIELLPGTVIRDVTILFSDSPSELSGSLQSASGQPTTDYHIVLLPEDRTLWRPGSRRIRSARPSTAGRFVFSNVPTGSYLLAALTDLDPLDLLDLSFLEQIAPAGVKVSVNEGEKKVQDLRIK